MRTLSRVALQLTDAVKNSVWPELSAAFGRKDWVLARRLHRAAFQLSMLLATATVILLALAGPRVFALWTHGRLHFDATTFDILLLAVLANSAWNASSSVALSANRHERMSLSYLGLSVASIAIACLLLPRVGLRGAALAMLFADLGILFPSSCAPALTSPRSDSLWRGLRHVNSRLPDNLSEMQQRRTGTGQHIAPQPPTARRAH
jgi:O-antigen/teichoic acid export membrane protein